jgi:hypothetical protein
MIVKAGIMARKILVNLVRNTVIVDIAIVCSTDYSGCQGAAGC